MKVAARNALYVAVVAISGALVVSVGGFPPDLADEPLAVRLASGSGAALLLFGYGGFVGRLPKALGLFRGVKSSEAYREELVNALVLGSSLVAGLTLIGWVIFF